MNVALDHALSSLADLQAAVEQLAASLLPGTPLPYRPPHLTPEQRAERDREAREERRERVDIAPGDSPDPCRREVADLLTDILIFADAASSEVAQTAGVERLPDASSHMADPRPYLAHIAVWLEQAADVEPDLPARVQRKCDLYVARADTILGHIRDGQTLPRECPFCQGRTPDHPEGGAHTLRVRLEHQQHRASEDCNRWCVELLVCENVLCSPGEEQCSRTYRGRPAWYLANEGEWLAACMDARDARRECRCGKPLPLIGAAGRPARYCSEVCRRAADAARKARERAA